MSRSPGVERIARAERRRRSGRVAAERTSDRPDAAVVFDDVSADRGGHTIWSEGTFTIPRGSVVGVIGPNGSGKTTLLEMVLGLRQAASGTIRVLGQRPRRGDPRIGYVPQNYIASIGDAIRGRDLVALGLAGARWGAGRLRKDERGRVMAALDAVGAGSWSRRRMSELSGGQQQRIALAQALVARPELLLLDEPLVSLDVRSQHEIVSLLADLPGSQHVTILIVTHDLNPLLTVLTGAVYLLDGHAHYGELGDVVDGELLSHLYGTDIKVVRTPQGELFTRNV
jgi:zinc/manganese transport system ATP-binding protein